MNIVTLAGVILMAAALAIHPGWLVPISIGAIAAGVMAIGIVTEKRK